MKSFESMKFLVEGLQKQVLQQWIKKYNGHRELKATGIRRTYSMTKGRKTTFEERIEIVQDALVG
jgi:transposase